MPMAAANADDLKNVSLFSDLDARQLKKLAGHFRERQVQAGTVLTREGEMSGVGFFVVAEGAAAVSVGGDDGKTLGPGDHLGGGAPGRGRERAGTGTATSDPRGLGVRFWGLR